MAIDHICIEIIAAGRGSRLITMLLPKLKQIFRTSIGAGIGTLGAILLFYWYLECTGGQG